MKKIILEWTTNPSPTNIQFTFDHHNVAGSTRTLRTFPTKRIEVEVPDEYTAGAIMELTNANSCEEL